MKGWVHQNDTTAAAAAASLAAAAACWGGNLVETCRVGISEIKLRHVIKVHHPGRDGQGESGRVRVVDSVECWLIGGRGVKVILEICDMHGVVVVVC